MFKINKSLVVGVMIISIVLSYACDMFASSPQKVFNVVGLNSNKIPKSFQRTFDEIRAQKEYGTLHVASVQKSQTTAAVYITTYFADILTKDIEQIEALAGNDETKPIIQSGLDMFQYAHEIFNTDYLRIAKMIDEGLDKEVIDLEIEKLETTKGVELDGKYFKTMDLLLPYAEKHGVEYSTIQMPYKARR